MPTTADLLSLAAHLVESSIDYTPDEFQAHLDAFVEAASDKMQALRIVFRAAEGRAATLKAEAALYAAAAKAHASTAERVKQRAYLLMEAAELAGEVLPGARLQANGGHAPLVFAPGFDPADLPFDLQRVTVEANADKVRIALAAGAVLPGVSIGERGRSLRWTEGK